MNFGVAFLVVILVSVCSAARFDASCTTQSAGMERMLRKFGCSKMYIPAMEKVCQRHDNCYSCQRGRRTCDADLCKGMFTAIGGSPVKCKAVAEFICGTVRVKGGAAYRKAKKNSCNNSLF